ncbi:MAG TPA: hypothetical protein VFN37_03300, partial [Candidatus Baltobacteraceae bacterium]|nr:hypothetical protein [Candidatus Baltobacteraceae bacterium]
LLWTLQRSGHGVVELPIAWADTSGSKVHIVRTSWSMLLSMLRLRLRYSWLWRIRLIAALGSETCVPVRSSRKVLMLGSCPPSLAGVYELLRDAGFTPVDAQNELAAFSPRAGRLGNGWLLRAAFFAWYTIMSPREYDAIVEFEETKPWFVPACSIKPTLLIKTERAACTPVYRWFYRRSQYVELDGHPESQGVDTTIALLDTHLHPAIFVQDSRASKLCYRNAASGRLEHLILR